MKARIAKKIVKKMYCRPFQIRIPTGRRAVKIFRKLGKTNCEEFLNRAWVLPFPWN